MDKILELDGFRGDEGGDYGPTGKQGGKIEDSPFFKPPRAIMLGGLVAFVPMGLTEEQYEEWYRRMTNANHVILGMREELHGVKRELDLESLPEPEGMGVDFGVWLRKRVDKICGYVSRFWYKGGL
jgi:hypothetical protein